MNVNKIGDVAIAVWENEGGWVLRQSCKGQHTDTQHDSVESVEDQLYRLRRAKGRRIVS